VGSFFYSGKPAKVNKANVVADAAKLLVVLENDIVQTNQIIAQLRAEREKLDQAISALEQLGGGGGAAGRAGRRRRHMSAEARKRISEAMRQRWAERKKKKG
jgi:gamma-glutamyl:cysteine ligase YbdK (ATP-grasp superfamily)